MKKNDFKGGLLAQRKDVFILFMAKQQDIFIYRSM